MMNWLTQPNEQQHLLSFLRNKLKNKPKDIKFNYPENKPVFSIYKFKKEKSQTPADDIYVIFPLPTSGTEYNLYRDDDRKLKARKNAFKNIINKDKNEIISVFSAIPDKKTYTFEDIVVFEVLSVLRNAKRRNSSMNIAIENQYKIYNLKWHKSRHKINLALLGFQIKGGKLKEFSGELCLKKMCYSKKNMEQEIKYMKMFGCHAGYKPQRIDLDDTEYRIVILMKYLGESLRKYIKSKYFDNNDKRRKKIIYGIALEIKKMHDKNIKGIKGIKGIVHGDLKPGNITLDNKIHIIDYDNAGSVGSPINPEKVKQAIKDAYPYRPLFIFKEFVKQSKTFPYEVKLQRTKAFDMFSLGIVIWEIYGGDYKKYKKIFEDNKYVRDYRQKYKTIDAEFRNLITQDLEKAKVDAETIRLIMRMVDINQCDVPNIDEVIKHFAPKV